MLKKWSSRWIDLKRYKTKDILLSVVRRRVPVLANKTHTVYRCCCPFHHDRTPSMKFYFNKGLQGWGYKCLGCGTAGDVFTFVMRFDGLEFWDAMLTITKHHTPATPLSPTASEVQLEIPFPQNPNLYFEDELPF